MKRRVLIASVLLFVPLCIWGIHRFGFAQQFESTARPLPAPFVNFVSSILLDSAMVLLVLAVATGLLVGISRALSKSGTAKAGSCNDSNT